MGLLLVEEKVGVSPSISLSLSDLLINCMADSMITVCGNCTNCSSPQSNKLQKALDPKLTIPEPIRLNTSSR